MKLFSSLRLIALSASLIMASMAVMASGDPQQLTLRDIVTQQYQLRQQVVAGKGAFKDMSEAQRKALAERQDRVLQMLDGSQTLDEMPPDQRVVVFNDLEWIKGAVAKAEDERLVCEYVYLTGSHIPRSVCMSAGERAQLTDDTRAGLRKTYKCDDCRE